MNQPRMITSEEATEILDSATNGYSVEVWLPEKGLLIVNPTLKGDFEFTLYKPYKAPTKPLISIHSQGAAWNLLIATEALSINV